MGLREREREKKEKKEIGRLLPTVLCERVKRVLTLVYTSCEQQ